MLTEVSISNGLDWTSDGRTLFYTDSATKRIDAFDFDPEFGSIDNRRTVIRFDDAIATPDGLAVDAEGTICWTAIWDAGCGESPRTADYSKRSHCQSAGRPARPSAARTLTNCSSPRPGTGLESSVLAREPRAGDIFVIDVGVCGQPQHRFAG